MATLGGNKYGRLMSGEIMRDAEVFFSFFFFFFFFFFFYIMYSLLKYKNPCGALAMT